MEILRRWEAWTGTDHGAVLSLKKRAVRNAETKAVELTTVVKREAGRAVQGEENGVESIVYCAKNDLVVYSNLRGDLKVLRRDPEGPSTVVGQYKAESAFAGLYALDDGDVLGATSTGKLMRFPFSQNNFTDQPTIVELPRANLKRFRYNNTSNTAIVAGTQEQLTVLADVATGTEVWKARNLPNDFLDLHMPIWDKDVCWLYDSPAKHSSSLFLAVTAYKEVRVYDIRIGRRPVFNKTHAEKAYNCCAADPRALSKIAVADITGTVELIDLRLTSSGNKEEKDQNSLQTLGTIKGITGAIRTVAYHPTEKLLAAVGLDRHLHIIDLKSRKHISKMYMKTRMNTVAWIPVKVPQKEEDEVQQSNADENSFENIYDDLGEESEEESEDAFAKLEEVASDEESNNKNKKKKKDVKGKDVQEAKGKVVEKKKSDKKTEKPSKEEKAPAAKPAQGKKRFLEMPSEDEDEDEDEGDEGEGDGSDKDEDEGAGSEEDDEGGDLDGDDEDDDVEEGDGDDDMDIDSDDDEDEDEEEPLPPPTKKGGPVKKTVLAPAPQQKKKPAPAPPAAKKATAAPAPSKKAAPAKMVAAGPSKKSKPPQKKFRKE